MFGFFKKKQPKVKSSKFFQEEFYENKSLKLDSSLKYITGSNVMIDFPKENLVVRSFEHFDIDGNQFEVINFDKQGNKSFRSLYDKFENVWYFLNLVTYEKVQMSETPAITQESIVLTEDNNSYQYDDFSGLIEIKVSRNDKINNELIRVYRRLLDNKEYEYLICNFSNENILYFYIGFEITKIQLENI